MAFTKDQIYTLILDALDQNATAATSGTNKESKWLNRNWDLIIEDLLRTYKPKFARSRATLSAKSGTPAFGWNYWYDVPADLLFLMPLTYLGKLNGVSIPFEYENRIIYTNEHAPLNIRYIMNAAVGDYDSSFVNVIILTAALKMAPWMVTSGSIIRELKASAKEAYKIAKRNDSLESTPEDPEQEDVISIRYSNTAVLSSRAGDAS